jgi:hypothetical protein
MNDEIRDRIHGGFDGSLHSQMSPALLRAIAESDAAEQREARVEREKKQRVEALAENSFRAGVEQAIATGHDPHLAITKGTGVGRTPAESLQYFAALSDAEDARLAVRQRLAYSRWEQAQAELASGDLTAPTAEEMASRAESEGRHREASIQGSVRRYERKQILKQARADALHDTLTIAAAAERYR